MAMMSGALIFGNVVYYRLYPIISYVLCLNAELNPIFHLLVLLGAHHILHVSRVRVNSEVDIIHLFEVGSLI